MNNFNVLDNVSIIPLENIKGQIIAIWIGIKNDIQYKVRYFTNCKAEEIYFYEWELKKDIKTYE